MAGGSLWFMDVYVLASGPKTVLVKSTFFGVPCQTGFRSAGTGGVGWGGAGWGGVGWGAITSCRPVVCVLVLLLPCNTCLMLRCRFACNCQHAAVLLVTSNTLLFFL